MFTTTNEPPPGPAMGSAFDALAPGFERQRQVPSHVPPSVRRAVLAALGDVRRPRILDLGAGTGRFGWPFVAAGDDYVGVDLSAFMLRAFAQRDAEQPPALVQADGSALPFPAASFDLVLLVAVFGDQPDWRKLIDETRRVLRPGGTIAIGRTVQPEDGIDATMKNRLATLLDNPGPRKNGRLHAAQHLATVATTITPLVPATWPAQRSPRQFLDRHATGARFSRLPPSTRDHALRALGSWAEQRFGSLDATFAETHRFELQLFSFRQG
jgi:ubiquinone/menaquinone biosynthesis C-methylase UbiE